MYADKNEKHILSSALYIGDIAYRKEGRKGSKIREREGDGGSRGRSREWGKAALKFPIGFSLFATQNRKSYILPC